MPLKATHLEGDSLQIQIKQGINPSQNWQEEKLVAKISAENSFEDVARF